MASLSGWCSRLGSLAVVVLVPASAAPDAPAFEPLPFTDNYCASCHNPDDKKGGLDLESLTFTPADPQNFLRWVRVHERVEAGEMPPKIKDHQPPADHRSGFARALASILETEERTSIARQGRAAQRRLNRDEYENSLRDLFQAPWLQLKGQFPEDGEKSRFNKIGEALDVSHVHLARYLSAADYAMRQVIAAHAARAPTTTTRHYAREQRSLVSRFRPDIGNTSPDRLTYPVLGLTTPQPAIRTTDAPLTVGAADPATRELEAVGWVSSNYVTGFTYSWDSFRAPMAARYRIRFSGYTLWAAPGGITRRFANEKDEHGRPTEPNPKVPDYDQLSPGRRSEPITVYTRGSLANRRVGGFDLTPEPAVHDLGEVWLMTGETLVPDASRFYRSRPLHFVNPLMQADGAPSVAFRWMEVEGPLTDDATDAGYRLLFGDLPLHRVEPGQPGLTVPVITTGDAPTGNLRNRRDQRRDLNPIRDVAVDVGSTAPAQDAARLMRAFVQQAYRQPAADADIARFVALVEDRLAHGLSFAEAMVAGYTAALASPGYLFLHEQPGPLDDHALATRLALFLTNSGPDALLRARAERGELRLPEILRAETERLLNDPRAERFTEAFLDYWIDLRKMEESTPSTTLYNDYYLDDALAEAAVAETRMFFTDMLRQDTPARAVVHADYTFLNERLADHYGIPGVQGIALRRVSLPADSPRGGILTQASILKVTANGTTTSPVLRGKWITERILGYEIPPPPPVAAVEPDIRGAVTIRQQLEKHRADLSCASCHARMDPPGFALESFDVMGGWRDRYRAVAEEKPGVDGRGKNGHPFVYHHGLPVDAAGEMPDGRPFHDIRDFKRLLLEDEVTLARNLTKQMLVYATGSPIRFSDRAEIDQIVARSATNHYGLRTLIHQIIQSDLFLRK